eukprot:4059517-Pleurochrysis_carterae.AAC.1
MLSKVLVTVYSEMAEKGLRGMRLHWWMKDSACREPFASERLVVGLRLVLNVNEYGCMSLRMRNLFAALLHNSLGNWDGSA